MYNKEETIQRLQSALLTVKHNSHHTLMHRVQFEKQIRHITIHSDYQDVLLLHYPSKGFRNCTTNFTSLADGYINSVIADINDGFVPSLVYIKPTPEERILSGYNRGHYVKQRRDN